MLCLQDFRDLCCHFERTSIGLELPRRRTLYQEASISVFGGYFITIAPDCPFDNSGFAGIYWRSRFITLSTESWLPKEKTCKEHFLLLIDFAAC